MLDASPIRNDWTREQADAIYNLPFMDLLFQAQTVHRQNFDPNQVQKSKLLSIKTGGCAEDCAYCSQSARNGAQLSASKLIEVERVISEARKAKEGGATRYCMGAAWRSPKDRDMAALEAMVKGVKDLGMETCMTLGMLDDEQVFRLRDSGLDYYNHNIDTSERYYSEIITTRTFGRPHRHPEPGARGWYQGLCRWHRWYGRAENGPHRHDADLGNARGASGISAGQHVESPWRIRRWLMLKSWTRSNLSAPWRWRVS